MTPRHFWSEQLEKLLPFTIVGNSEWEIKLVGKKTCKVKSSV